MLIPINQNFYIDRIALHYVLQGYIYFSVTLTPDIYETFWHTIRSNSEVIHVRETY